VSTPTPVAFMEGVPRIVRGAGIVHPTGNPNCERSYDDEKAFRRAICEKALQAISTDVKKGGTEFLPEVGLVVGDTIVETAP
jgi:hypothetical protein